MYSCSPWNHPGDSFHRGENHKLGHAGIKGGQWSIAWALVGSRRKHHDALTAGDCITHAPMA
jgi:hypothetical protein